MKRWAVPNQAHKLLTGAGVVGKGSFHGAGHRPRAGFLNAAHDHAHVGSFDHDRDSLGLQQSLEGVGDLRGEAFLNLEATGIHFTDAGDF